MQNEPPVVPYCVVFGILHEKIGSSLEGAAGEVLRFHLDLVSNRQCPPSLFTITFYQEVYNTLLLFRFRFSFIIRFTAAFSLEYFSLIKEVANYFARLLEPNFGEEKEDFLKALLECQYGLVDDGNGPKAIPFVPSLLLTDGESPASSEKML